MAKVFSIFRNRKGKTTNYKLGTVVIKELKDNQQVELVVVSKKIGPGIHGQICIAKDLSRQSAINSLYDKAKGAVGVGSFKVTEEKYTLEQITKLITDYLEKTKPGT